MMLDMIIALFWQYIGFVMAALFSIAFGVLWYGPLMGEVWANAYGVDVNDKEAMDNLTKVFNEKAMLSTLCMRVFEIVVINHLSAAMNVASVTDACYVAGIFFVGFGVPLIVIQSVYNPRGVNKTVLLFDLMYQLFHLVGITTIIAYFKNL